MWRINWSTRNNDKSHRLPEGQTRPDSLPLGECMAGSNQIVKNSHQLPSSAFWVLKLCNLCCLSTFVISRKGNWGQSWISNHSEAGKVTTVTQITRPSPGLYLLFCISLTCSYFIYLFNIYIFWPLRCFQDLSFPTRNWASAQGSESMEVITTGPPFSPWLVHELESTRSHSFLYPQC